MTTRYHAVAVEEQVAWAQRVLDTHITSSATGWCLQCGSFGPCRQRETAAVVFSRALWLPRRTPGATRPESVGARTAGVGLWR